MHRGAKLRSGLGHLAQLAYPSHFHPFHHEEISCLIEASSMRAHELARFKAIARELTCGHIVARRIVAKMLDDVIVAIHQGDASKEIGDHHIAVLVDIEMAWRVRSIEEVDVFSIKREALNSLVAAVRNIKHRLCAARVEEDAVRAEQLAGLF